MEKLFGFDEPLWRLPLWQRISGWALAMGWQWGRIPLLAGNVMLAIGGIWVWSAWLIHPSQTKIGAGILVIPILIYLLAILMGLAGTATGAIVGFCAPVAEPAQPLQSSFFHRVSKRTLLTWTCLCMAFAPISLSLLHRSDSLVLSIAIEVILLAFCIWSATATALREKKPHSLN